MEFQYKSYTVERLMSMKIVKDNMYQRTLNKDHAAEIHEAQSRLNEQYG